MVDFKKRLAGKKADKPTDPVKLYDTLDRAHDKGPLRPAQEAILSEWFASRQSSRDVIVKLHTGQGKTLVGLLMLQARLNAGNGPVVYLCPDHFLIAQTCEQAKQFGIPTCTAENNLPDDFINSKKILITSVQKLFNGLTKFGLDHQSIEVDTVLMDDAHACSDRIREACRIRIASHEPAYKDIRTLFGTDLELQGVGTYADICNDKRDALLPVPYWSWIDREGDVARILSTYSDRKTLKFTWPLLKDMIRHCHCVVSGAALEIEPSVPPLRAFGSYHRAEHRVFMSATVTDDAFLVKGLQLEADTIINPLTYIKETWSGEKMILLPSVIHDDLGREELVKSFGCTSAKRTFGVAALVPSFNRTKDWAAYGSTIADKDTVWEAVDSLKKGKFSDTVVLVNRYDGIDLPDEACRILILDEKPYSESLSDMYQERCRQGSEATLMRTVRTVEQGMGRSVRGEKDYSVIIALGTDLVRLLREKVSRKYLSSQMVKQIELGLEISDMAKQDIEDGNSPISVLKALIRQCLQRDPDWKAYYAEQMDTVIPSKANENILRIYASELEAEQAYLNGDYSTASKLLQDLLDRKMVDSADKGWYIQERARYLYVADRPESQTLQVAAHKNNRLLLKPPTGVTVAKLALISHGRAERIADWVRNFDTYSELNISVTDILDRLVFGSAAEKFEAALDELSDAIGFVGERPDSEWKEGPDNLWALDDAHYIIFECKSEVDLTRAEINKREAEQMNRSSSWFEKHYPGKRAKRVIIHPAGKIESAAAFTHDVVGMRERDLKAFVKAVREFFKSLESVEFRDLSATRIQSMVDNYKISVGDLFTGYASKLRDLKQ